MRKEGKKRETTERENAKVKAKVKAKAIKQYEEVRDNMSVRCRFCVNKLVNRLYNGARRARRRRGLICRESASEQTARLAAESKNQALI
jgi:hypothetical protein